MPTPIAPSAFVDLGDSQQIPPTTPIRELEIVISGILQNHELAAMPDDYAAPVTETINRINAIVGGAKKKLAAVMADSLLSSLGQSQKAAEIKATAQQAIDREQQRLSADIQVADDLRARIVEGRLVADPTGGWSELPPTPPTGDALMRHAEIRRALLDLPADTRIETVRRLYRDAVTTGSDPVLVAALEDRTSPYLQSLLISPNTLDEGRKIRLDRSPLAAGLAHRERANQMRSLIVGKAHTVFTVPTSTTR